MAKQRQRYQRFARTAVRSGNEELGGIHRCSYVWVETLHCNVSTPQQLFKVSIFYAT